MVTTQDRSSSGVTLRPRDTEPGVAWAGRTAVIGEGYDGEQAEKTNIYTLLWVVETPYFSSLSSRVKLLSWKEGEVIKRRKIVNQNMMVGWTARDWLVTVTTEVSWPCPAS